MNIQTIYKEIERKLPSLDIYDDEEYTKPFDEEEFEKIVLKVYAKYGLLNDQGRPNGRKLWEFGIKDYDLNLIYQSYLQRLNRVLVKTDEKISKIIDDAVNRTGKFKDAKGKNGKYTTLQIYRVMKGRPVNDTQYINQTTYDERVQYYYMGTLTIREWYNTYLERRNRDIENEKNEQYKAQKKEDKSTSQIKERINFGYKGKDKLKSLCKHYGKEYVEPEDYVSNYFPLKQNIKHYQLHKVRPRNSYIIDLMKSGKIYYLLAINANTRYLYAEPTNTIFDEDDEDGIVKVSNSAKNEKLCADVLLKLINKGVKIKYLESDGEGGFGSDYVKRIVYERHGIKYNQVRRQKKTQYPSFMKDESDKWNKKTDPIHGSLGIVDRVTRTIRDMAYNMKIGVILPNDMNKIVEYYNNAPHKGLSKYAGFSVSPSMVQNDPQLEEWIARKIMQANYEVINGKGFKLKRGTKVKVYNEKDSLSKRRSVIQPGEFMILRFDKGLYRVKNKTDNSIQLVPRYKLTPNI